VNAQGWADRINTDVERSVAAILKVGQDLIAAKAELRARAAAAELVALLPDLDPAAGGTGTEWLNLRSTAEECLEWAKAIASYVRFSPAAR